MDMRALGKGLVYTGLIIAIAGGCLLVGGRYFAGRRVPGDFVYEGERLKVYFPLGTSLAVSLALSGLMWLWNRLR